MTHKLSNVHVSIIDDGGRELRASVVNGGRLALDRLGSAGPVGVSRSDWELFARVVDDLLEVEPFAPAPERKTKDPAP